MDHKTGRFSVERVERIEREMEQKPISWIYRCSKKHLWAVALLAGVSAAIAGSFLLLALISSALLDVASGSRQGSLWRDCLILVGLIGLQAILNIVNSNIRVRVSGKLEMGLKRRMFAAILRKPYLNPSEKMDHKTGRFSVERVERIEREMEQKPISWIYRCSKNHLWAVALLAGASAAIAGSFLLLALISSALLDVASGSRQGSLWRYCLILVGLIGLQAILNIVNSNIRVRFSGKLDM